MKNKKKSFWLPTILFFSFLLIADLLFKGAIYRRLPIDIQEKIDLYIGK